MAAGGDSGAAPGRALHVVQIGYDDSVFAEGAPSDTLRRQLWYGRELAIQRPGSRMSVAMFTGSATARRLEQENVVFVPVRAKRPHELPKLFPVLLSLHRERAIDVIATQTIYQDAWVAMLFGRLCGANVVGQVHIDFFSPIARRENLGGGVLGRTRAALGARLMRHLHTVRVVGQRVRQRMRAEGLHDNVHVVPVPVTLQGIAGDVECAAATAPRVLFVGRLVAEKNLDDWLRVAALVGASHPTAEFEIVGDGPLRRALETRAEQVGVAPRVRFRGFVPYESLSDAYRSSAVFLLTSHCEGFGRVVVEACLHGVPVVGTRISGVEDIVEDGETGFLHTPGDVEGMAASVSRLLENDRLRRQMGEAAHQLVRERFDPERLARAWVSLLVSAAR